MSRPLTLTQAEHICSTYQFLEATSYDKEFPNATPILSVVVAPYRELAQQDFIDDYDLLGYTDLSAYNSKEGYDVIVIARYQHDHEICLWMDIRNFVKRNMMSVAKQHKSYILSDGGRHEMAV